MNFDQLQIELKTAVLRRPADTGGVFDTRSLDNVPLVGGVQNPYNYNADYGNTDSVSAPRAGGQLSL